jgi:hypothetical protein
MEGMKIVLFIIPLLVIYTVLNYNLNIIIVLYEKKKKYVYSSKEGFSTGAGSLLWMPTPWI